MPPPPVRDFENVRRTLVAVGPDLAQHARAVRALLRRGAGEEEVVEALAELTPLPTQRRIALARDLLRLGVRPTGAFRRARRGPDVCTICEQEVPFCWGCACGFRICQACLEENRWGLTCNNVTWECPDCGGMRSF